MKTPKPKHTHTVCTVCGLDWKAHGTKPTIEKCVELLVAEVKRLHAFHRPMQAATGVAQFRGPLGYGPTIGKAS